MKSDVIVHAFSPGDRCRFNYPKEFTTLPEYTAHRGQIVTVLRPQRDGDEYDYEGDPMYEIRADDGWTGSAWESELASAHAEGKGDEMTTLNRKLRRVVPSVRTSYVLILHPEAQDRPAMVEIREKGRRQGHSISVGALYVVLATRAADQNRKGRVRRVTSLRGAR